LTLVTHNRKDFDLLHAAWIRWSGAWQTTARHLGILILPQAWSVERAVLELSSATTSLVLPNHLYRYLPTGGWQPSALVEYQLLDSH
jgi:hypothetical protein